MVLDTSLNMRDLGVSAYDKSNITKGALGSFLFAIEKNKIPRGSYLLVEHLDRLSRAQTVDALTQFLSIIQAGITIVTLVDGQVYSREIVDANPYLLLVSISIMSASHDESEKKSQRGKTAWSNKKKQAIEFGKLLTHRTPLWIEVLEGKPTLIQDRAEIVKGVYEMARQGIGNHTIVQVLNKNFPAWNKVGHWQVSYVQKMLTSVAVYGAIDLDGTIVENYFPQLLTREEWNNISVLRSSRKTTDRAGSRKGKSVSNLFSGLLKCGYCKSSMQMAGYVETRKSMHKRRSFLVCSGARTGASDCGCIQWNYVDLESSFLFQISQLNVTTLFQAGQKGKSKQLEKDAARIRIAISETSKKYENIQKALEEDFVSGLAKRAGDLEKEKKVLEKDLINKQNEMLAEHQNTTSGTSRLSLLLQLAKEQKDKNDDEKRVLREALSELIRSMVEKIELFPSGPVLSKDQSERENRFAKVYLKSGKAIEIS